MSEVEKMYENAGVNKSCRTNIKFDDCIYSPSDCGYYNYPPFTAEKQLKIIAFLVNKGYNVTFANLSNKFSLEQISKSLALCINSKWNNLTESEQEQIKEILE